MYKALDLANYIVDKCIKDDAPITNLQLQRKIVEHIENVTVENVFEVAPFL